ncbi:hypothetical protein OUZ56_004255 [Daphnia magna]|uniref:Uncharacterized protein n=1 Tax=Daphnia magna TaxID=35525 RepID=A0ABQ9YPC0_9CRUS|nr:hypothetical protein OUZ56_004255 [Daphnia magna]
MMKIMSDKLNGCLLHYPVMCFKGFFVKQFTISVCMCWCFALSAMPAAEPAACTPAINVPQEILTLLEGHYCLHEDPHLVQSTTVFIYFVLLTISTQHPRKSSLLILLFFSPLLSQLTWICFKNISIFWTANIHLPLVQHCRFDNFGSFVPSGPHATTFSSSSCRCLRLHLIAVFVDVFAFISISSSSPSSPSRRLRLHLHLVVFAFISISSSSPSSPSRRLRLHPRFVVFAVFAFISRFVVFAVFVYAITSSPASASLFT